MRPRYPSFEPISPVKFYSPTKAGIDENGSDSNMYKPFTEAVLANDIYYDIQRHSGRYKHKDRPGLLKCLHNRAVSPRVTSGDRSFLACKFLPNRQNLRETIRYDADRPICGTFEKDGDIFVCATQGGKIRVYNTQTDETTLSMTFKMPDEADTLLECTVSPDARHAAYSLFSGRIVLQPIERPDSPLQFFQLDENAFPRNHATCLKFSPSRDELLGGASDTSLYFFDLHKLKRTLHLPIHEGRVTTLAFADDSSHIIYSAGEDGLVKVWDRRALHEFDAQPVGILAGHKVGINFIDSKGDGRYLISSSQDQTIKLWDIRRLADSATVQAAKDNVSKFSWDFRLQSPSICPSWFTPLPGDVSVMTYRGHAVIETEIRCRFSPMATTGQRFIYTGCYTGRVRIYDVLSGNQVSSLGEFVRSGPGCVRDVSWHPYLPVVKACAFDYTVREWIFNNSTNTYVKNLKRRLRDQKARVARAIFTD